MSTVSVRLGRSGDDPHLLGLWALLALRDLKLDSLPVIQRLVAVHLDRGEVDEYVLPSVDRDEAVALLAVEPLDGALCHGALPHFDGAGSRDPRPERSLVGAAASAGPGGVSDDNGRTRTLHEDAGLRTPPKGI